MKDRIIIPKKAKVFNIILLSIGFIVLLISLVILVDGFIYHIGGEKVEAEVKLINEDEKKREIWIKYDYNGQNYEEKLDHWDGTLDVGDKTIIYCLKDNPEKFVSDSDYIFSFILLFIIGGGMFTYFLIQFLKYIKELKRVKLILEKGNKVDGIIISVEEMSKNSSFGDVPWVIVATTKDREDPYISKFVWINANIHGYINRKVDIYLYNDDYYIDYLSVR